MLDFDLEAFLAQQTKRVRQQCQALEARIVKRRRMRLREALDAMTCEDRIAHISHASGRRRPDMDSQGMGR